MGDPDPGLDRRRYRGSLTGSVGEVGSAEGEQRAAAAGEMIGPTGSPVPQLPPGPGWGPPPDGPPDARPPTGSPHRWGFGAYVLVEALFLAVSVVIGYLFIGDAAPSVGILVVGLAVPTLLAAGTAVLITALRGNGPRVDLGLTWSRRDLGVGLALGLGSLALTIPASLVYAFVVGPDQATSAVGQVFSGQHVGLLMALFVFVVVVFVAPVCEEIVYRGLLWGAVEKHGAGRWPAFALTTLLFALAHFELTRTPLLLVVAIPIGLARVYTGRLPASIVAHQVNNLLPGLVLLFALTRAVPL